MDKFGGIFEDLTINDEVGRVARRKAIAVANKRVDDRFGDFIKSASSAEEAEERIGLIKSDLENAVKEACAEFDVDHSTILASITDKLSKPKKEEKTPQELEREEMAREHNEKVDKDKDEDEEAFNVEHPGWDNNFGPAGKAASRRIAGSPVCPECQTPLEENDRGQLTYCPLHRKDVTPYNRPQSSSVKEARRPKMCPYHSELVNASLQTGEPQYAAFAPLVGGDSHCGGSFESKCNFKPAMVTQDFWDQKETERAERKEQRELDRQQENSFEMEAPHPDEILEESHDISDQASLSDLDNAPSAVGEGMSGDSYDAGESFAESAEPVLAKAANCGCDEGQMCEKGSCEKCDEKRKKEASSNCKCWNGYERVPGTKPCAEGSCQKCDNHRKSASWTITAISDGDSWQKNEKVEQSEGPSPKIDKGVWKTLDRIDVDAGPYKTRQQDVLDGPDYSKNDSHGQATADSVLEQTKAVTTQDKLPSEESNAGFNTDKNLDVNHTDTFNNDGQANPVTSEVLAARAAALDFDPRIADYQIQNAQGNMMDPIPDPSQHPIRRNDGSGSFIDYTGMSPADQQKALDTNFPNPASKPPLGMGNMNPLGAGSPQPSQPPQPSGQAQQLFNMFDKAPGNQGGGMDLGQAAGQALNAVGQPVQDAVQGIGNAVTNPMETAKGIANGVGNIFSAAAHKVNEVDGKFYVIEDGNEKAAGPFDTEADARSRAKELNNLENLEREAGIGDFFNGVGNAVGDIFGGGDQNAAPPQTSPPGFTQGPAGGGMMNSLNPLNPNSHPDMNKPWRGQPLFHPDGSDNPKAMPDYWNHPDNTQELKDANGKFLDEEKALDGITIKPKTEGLEA